MIKPKHEDVPENIWQVAAGDGERNYWDIFRQFGVMLIGPGGEGDYTKHKDAYNRMTPARRRPIRQFVEVADKDDYVVLKHRSGSKWIAIAIGRIKPGYYFKPVFGDVEGFQLQHCRRVDWRQTSEKPIPGLGRGGGCFSQVIKARDVVKRRWEKGKPIHKFDRIPNNPKSIELIDSLVIKGLPRQNAKRIANEIERLKSLAEWYEDNGKDCDVPEHETRTFLIVPLIMSLGWDEKKVKIEWKHKDVALFDADYSEQNEPVVIIESKRLWHGLGDAPEQAERYTRKYPTCKTFVVSDGIRYKLFTKPKPARKFRFSAYLNLLTPTRKHPYKPDVGGAVSFLLEMFHRRQSNRRV